MNSANDAAVEKWAKEIFERERQQNETWTSVASKRVVGMNAPTSIGKARRKEYLTRARKELLARAAVLKRFGLPDRSAFEIEPHRDDQGIWRIKFSHEGDPAILMSQGHATRLADEIRSVNHHLAKQIETCLEKAKRYSKTSK